MEWKEDISDIHGGRIEKAKVEAQRQVAIQLEAAVKQLEIMNNNNNNNNNIKEVK